VRLAANYTYFPDKCITFGTDPPLKINLFSENTVLNYLNSKIKILGGYSLDLKHPRKAHVLDKGLVFNLALLTVVEPLRMGPGGRS
jgi:hypothetical protein